MSTLARDAINNSTAVWLATAGYFGYVVLGGIDHDLHHHIYTGDENEPEVYDEFFSFKHYFNTYRVHVLTAGAWLLTGVYNLRNPPEFAGKGPAGAPLYQGWVHKTASGWTYFFASLLKGVTACALSVQSHSLGFARWPMVAFGVYDVVSLFLAIKYIVQGNVPEHKAWMIRNFGVGAGSIWVRVIGAIWAACDLNFMKSADFYRRMNNVVLTSGFTQGVLFSEWWLAVASKNDALKSKWELAMAANAVLTIVGARHVYAEMKKEGKWPPV